MTNEEKAEQIVKSVSYRVYRYEQGFAYHSALEMAKWKDEQFKEALNNILIECDACFDEQTTTTLQAIINHQIEIL